MSVQRPAGLWSWGFRECEQVASWAAARAGAERHVRVAGRGGMPSPTGGGRQPPGRGSPAREGARPAGEAPASRAGSRGAVTWRGAGPSGGGGRGRRRLGRDAAGGPGFAGKRR